MPGVVFLQYMQLDHCLEKNMWRDLASFKSMSDKKPSQPVSDTFADTFMNVTRKSTQKNYKKRCSIDEVWSLPSSQRR